MLFRHPLISPLVIISSPEIHLDHSTGMCPEYLSSASLATILKAAKWQLSTFIGNDSRLQHGIDLHEVFLMLKEFGHVSELLTLNDLLGVMISRKVICHIVGQKCHLCLV